MTIETDRDVLVQQSDSTYHYLTALCRQRRI